MQKKGRKTGLIIKEEKIKYMTMQRQKTKTHGPDLKIEKHAFQGVNTFKYLGIVLTNNIDKSKHKYKKGNS